MILKTCPFCGKNPKMFQNEPDNGHCIGYINPEIIIQCDNCDFSLTEYTETPKNSSMNEYNRVIEDASSRIISRWNTRYTRIN